VRVVDVAPHRGEVRVRRGRGVLGKNRAHQHQILDKAKRLFGVDV
jgi:hypothetical protein